MTLESKEGDDPLSVALEESDICIQIYDLPKGFASENVLKSVGNYIGKFVKSDPNNFKTSWKSFLRIRVTLQVCKPLKRRMKIKREGGNWGWINFKYERLSTYCFVCGMLGHADRDCAVVYANPEKEVERAYGPWLRAPTRNIQVNTGAKWLRNSGSKGSSSLEYGGSSVFRSAARRDDLGPDFVEVDGIVREKSGVQSGITVISRNQGDREEFEIQNADNDAGINDVVVELKRKRMKGNTDGEDSIVVKDASENFIDVEIVVEQVGRWRFTGFYGYPERRRRYDSWNLLRNLARTSNLPWCVMGDFNDLMYATEKEGGRNHPRRLLDGFCNVIEESGLHDLGFSGHRFTWERGRGTDQWIQERLDRGLANTAWRNLFPDAEIKVVEVSTSDHLPLFLHLNKKIYVPKSRRFKFENLWLREKDCKEIVESSWNEERDASILWKIHNCSNKLEEWGGGIVKEFKQNLQNARNEMRRFRARKDRYGVRKYDIAMQEYHELLKRQEVYWQQRAKQFWLREGDSNSRFFHKTSGVMEGLTDRELVNKVTNEQNESLMILATDEEVLANILKSCLNQLISDKQSAFVEGRLLTDNALIAFEMNHYIKRKTQGKTGVVGLKLDVSKAYDRLEWRFLEQMLKRFGFSESWVDRMMLCVKSVSYTFTHNGSIFGEVIPERGLHQGDPISPYLYILCVEGLSSIIRRNEAVGLIHGCVIARGAPAISHLLFADDCYLFFRAANVEAKIVKDILNRYERMSGQAINFHKSSVNFSPNTAASVRQEICQSLGVREVYDPGKYLGMPMRVGRKKVETFQFLKDRVKQKLQGWGNKSISKAGKLILLKTAAQSIPNFWMNLLLIPEEICDDIEKIMNSFWWCNGSSTSKGIKWISWKRLCVVKEGGGLGMKDLHNFNLAMLAKQGWRLVNNDNSLVSRLMQDRYYPKGDFLNATVGPNPSFMWRSIMAAQDLVRQGCRKRIGDGMSTRVWRVPWLPDSRDGCLITEMPIELEEATVAGLMDESGLKWDEDILQDLCNERDRELILQIPIPVQNREDNWF
ncbi:hypothetical protein AgCh_002851 [Apium graveolens]